MRLCIATPSETTLTETFIKAHLERLPHPVTHLYGYYLDYRFEGELLRDRHARRHPRRGAKLLNLLPRYLEFRLRKRYVRAVDDVEAVAAFLRERQIEVVLAEYGTAGAFITPACRAAGVPLVVHFHGFDATRRSTLQEFAAGYAAMFDYAAGIIAVSERMRQDLIGLGCPPGKIAVCHYGPDPGFFDLQPDYTSNTLVGIGRLADKKAPHLTLLAFAEALRACPELRLVLAGDGNLRGVCEDLIAVLGLSHAVTLAGPTAHERVRQVLQDAFAFVQHSVQAYDGDCEGTPVAVLEASAAGLPILATRHAGIPDVVVEGETGLLVDERDVSGMAAHMVRLARDRSRAQAMGRAARAHVRARFSMENHLAAVDAVLRQAAGQA